jgi:cellobiose phosphorylase
MLSGQDACGGAHPEIRPWAHHPGQMPSLPEEQFRSDDCLWFFNAIPVYLAETGDLGFLDVVVPYADQGAATVLGHLRRALEFNLARTGRNGLPCGLLADWNDCLKLGFHGESVFVTFQVRYGLTVYAELCRRLGRAAEAAWADGERAALDAKIQQVCWDGRWFIWAIGEDGVVFGTRRGAEGRLYLNTQVWAVISGAATMEQRDACLDAVREQLASEYGLALCAPPFSKTPVKVMRAVLFNPGNKENGGIFCHTQSWAVLAEVLRGNGDQAYAYYRAFMPAAQNDRAEIRQIEPFANCQSTHARPSPKFGASRVAWLSGTASWSHYTATQWILGIRPEIDGLRIAPCIPRAWDGFEVTRQFRGATYHIVVRNPSHVNGGVSRLTVNGAVAPGNLVAPAPAGATVEIEAVLGA